MNDRDQDKHVQTSLATLLEGGLFVDGDWVESKDQDPNGEVRLVQLADVGDGIFRDRSSRFLTIEKARELRCTFLEPGDILVARMPEPLGRACIFPGLDQPAVTVVDVCIARPNPKRVRAAWLVSVINSPEFRGAMSDFIRGTTRQRISRKNLGKLDLHVPAINVQADIAAALGRVESARRLSSAHVANARAAIERLRRAILTAACSGRLTEDWRSLHPDAPVVEPPLGGEAVAFRKGRKKELPIELPMPDLPDSYVVTTVGHAAELLEYGTSKRCGASVGDAVPVLRMGNIQGGRLETSDLKYTEPDDEIERLLLKKGDLLFNRTNSPALVGKSAVFKGAVAMSFASYLIRVRFSPSIANPDFVNLWMNSSYGRLWARLAKTDGVSQSNINGTKLSVMPISLPPIAEQAEIVRRTEETFALADRLSSQIEQVEWTLDRILRGSLSKACRGELAPAQAAHLAEIGDKAEVSIRG